MANDYNGLPSAVQQLQQEQAEIKEMLASLLDQKMTIEKPLNAKQLCERLGVSMPTLSALIKRGHIKSVHVLNQRRFIWNDVLTQLQNKKENKYGK